MEDYRQRNLSRSGKRIVRVAFMEPNDLENSLMSRMASCLTANDTGKTYSHVEVMFSDGAVTSITQNPGTVHYDDTRFLSNPRYRCFFETYLTAKQEDAMQAFARSCAAREVPFNQCGMFWNFIPCCFKVRKTGDAYFCSEYVTQLFQTIGYLADLDPATTSPNDLYRQLKNDDLFKKGINEKLFYVKKHLKQTKLVGLKTR
jgi:hypothetical protein